MNKTFPARFIAVLRILIGILFLWLGVSMLLDSDLLYGGLLYQLNQTGGPVRIYRVVFMRLVEFRETLVVYLASAASILIGLLFVTGTLFSLSSLAAAFFVMNFGLASSSWNRPRQLVFFLATLLLLMLGRMGAGLTWGVDGLLIRHIKDSVVLFPLRRKAPQ